MTKIVSLHAENFKRLRAIDLTPADTATSIELRGPNASGKSSILDAIYAALGGADAAPDQPIRKGANEAIIKLDLGDVVVTRRFRPKVNPDDSSDVRTVTDLVVSASSGARFPSPQRMLDDLVGAISFDPLEFARARPADRVTTLRALLPSLSATLSVLDANYKETFVSRTEANREVARLRASTPPEPQTSTDQPLPDALVDLDGLTVQLANAATHNTDRERRRSARDQAATDVAFFHAEAGRIDQSLPVRLKEVDGREAENLRQLDDQIADLISRLDAAKAAREAALSGAVRRRTEVADEVSRAAQELRDRASALQAKLDAAEPLPDPIDVAALTNEIAAARQTNELIQQRERRSAHLAALQAAETTATTLTQKLTTLAEERLAAIAAAPLPIPGLSLSPDTDDVLFNAVPLDQASAAEKVRVSAAIAMAMNPTLKVITIRDASLLDRRSRSLLHALARERGYQLWLELTDDDPRSSSGSSTSSTTTVVIEDGGAVTLMTDNPDAPASTTVGFGD
jgi:hypothetical protein